MNGRKPKPITDPKAKPPKPPAEIASHPKALAEWKRIVKVLKPKRVLSEADEAALAIYALSYAEYLRAQTEIAANGAIVTLPGNQLRRNPWCVIQEKAWDRIRPLLAEFGLTPSARARLQLTEPDEPDEVEI